MNNRRLIEVDALCSDLLHRWDIADKQKEDMIISVLADVVTPIIACQPTIDAIPVKHGYWIGDICSCCNRDLMDYFHYTEDGCILEHPEFCPNCGAKMDG